MTDSSGQIREITPDFPLQSCTESFQDIQPKLSFPQFFLKRLPPNTGSLSHIQMCSLFLLFRSGNFSVGLSFVSSICCMYCLPIPDFGSYNPLIFFWDLLLYYQFLCEVGILIRHHSLSCILNDPDETASSFFPLFAISACFK